MDWLFIQMVAVNSLIFGVIGSFILRIRHRALQEKASTNDPYPMLKYFLLLLFGMFVLANLIGYFIAGKPWISS